MAKLSGKDVDFEFGIRPFGFGQSLLDSIGTGQYDTQTTVPVDFGFSEDAYLYIGFAQYLFEVVKLYLVAVAFDDDGFGGRGCVEADSGHGQSQYGTGVEGQTLRGLAKSWLPCRCREAAAILR